MSRLSKMAPDVTSHALLKHTHTRQGLKIYIADEASVIFLFVVVSLLKRKRERENKKQNGG